MNENGFTLVEILVALVVGAMLLSSISWVISGLATDLKTAEARDHLKEVASVSAFLDRELSAARFADQDGQNLPRSKNSLAFEMSAPDALRQSGYVRASLSSLVVDGGERLVLDFAGANIPQTVLLDDVQSISMDYVETENQTYPGRFLQEIQISVLEKDSSDPQIIRIHPKINSVGACVFDVISQRCRT